MVTFSDDICSVQDYNLVRPRLLDRNPREEDTASYSKTIGVISHVKTWKVYVYSQSSRPVNSLLCFLQRWYPTDSIEEV
jgi:hypothetical protein